jgi:hypothetical protein
MLDAIDRLLGERADAVGSGQRLAIGAYLLTIILALAPLGSGLRRRRRARGSLATGLSGNPPASRGRDDGGGSGPPPAAGDALPRREGSRARELRELSGAPR